MAAPPPPRPRYPFVSLAMNLATFFHGRRDRRLLALAGIAAVGIAAAGGALYYREAVVTPHYKPMELFPGLAHKLMRGEATHIYIVSKKYGAFEVAFVPQKGWVLPDRGGYPASFDTVKEALVAVAAMQTVEPKTDRPDWYHYVDLDPPPQGDGINVTLAADKGYILASMIVGKSESLGDDVGLFVRRAGEKQSYLVKSPAEIKANPIDWMDKNVVALAAPRIASALVRPPTGPAYTASRPAPGTPFTLAPLPKGRELAYPGAADATAGALSDFSFDDIKPATAFDFNNAARLVLQTFDGLTVTVDAVTQDSATWVRMYAEAKPGEPKTAKEALAINARTEGWAFKLPAERAASLLPTLESLLKPKK
jgi:hypothetical protein